MITAQFDTALFNKQINNVIDYSIGFIDGVNKGRAKFLQNFGLKTIEMLKQYVDASARVNPSLLHHVYEWDKAGSPDSRLFDVNYTITGNGLSFNSNFRQSRTIKDGSRTPFYDKARIMEDGIAVTIRPRKAKVLAFEDNGEQVFTKGPVTVNNPGGNTKGQFENVFNSFFNVYFTQAFMKSSGIQEYLENPQVFKDSIKAGAVGRSKGLTAGYNWISKAGVES